MLEVQRSCLLLQSSCLLFLEGLHNHYDLSAPLFRLLLRLPRQQDAYHARACLHIVSTILQLDHSALYSGTPLTAVLKLFPPVPTQQQPTLTATAAAAGFQQRAQYEPKSSPFSIANLAGPAASSSIQTTAPKATEIVAATNNATIAAVGRTVDINNEEDVLRSLLATPSHTLERHIRTLFEMAVNSGKLAVIRTALTRLLIVTSNVIVKSEANLPRRSVALLLDWLQVIDPELQESPEELRKMLLFAKYRDQPVGIGLGGYSQAYLLGAFTQQANWKTLEQTVFSLLAEYDVSLNPGGVLDFVWAVMRVPKLWQGRERRSPRHAKPPLLLQVDTVHLLTLAQYIIGEKSEHGENNESSPVSSLPDRMALLLQWYGDNQSLYKTLVDRLCRGCVNPIDSVQRKANRSLLFQLYLRRPCILSHLSTGTSKILPVIAAETSAETGDGESSADVAIHCLLTMICSPDSGKDFRKRLHELEAALRTLTAKHPLLLLRHFHLIYSGLDGLAHLHLMVLKGNNHVEVLVIIVGILEQLHPYLFSPRHNKAVKATMDCYMDIFAKHGSPNDLALLTTRIIDLLHAWLATDRPRALAYLVPKTDLLKSLSQQAKEWRPLAVAASSAPTFPTEPPTVDPTLNAPPLPQPPTNWFNIEAASVTAELTRAKSNEDLVEAWLQLDYLSSRAPLPLVVRHYTNNISNGVHSSHHKIRSIAWNLMSRVLVHDPSLANQFVPAVVSAVQSENCSVVRAACDHLPDVVLMMHASAPVVLTAAFSAITTKVPNSLPSLTKAITLLTIHTGS